MKPFALLHDLAETWGYRDVIAKYAWVDIRSRFDRTVLGPFWVVVTTLLWVFTVGLVMAQLFKQDLTKQLPYLAFGVFAWQFVSTVIMEASAAFVSQKQFMGAYRLPVGFFALRVVVRNIIVLSFLTTVAIPVALYFDLLVPSAFLHIVLVFAVYALIAVPLVLVLGFVGARFLDTAPLLTILINIMMLVTPVFWEKKLLPPDHPLALYNPLVPVLEIYRDIFLVGGAPVEPYLACLKLAVILWILAFIAFGMVGRRVNHWF